jgi:predicted nucleotidyltransferase
MNRVVSADRLDAELRRRLAGAEGLVSAYVFGSAADGRTHRESDVDVAVLLRREAYPTPASRFEMRVRLIGLLGRPLGREADVVVLNDAPPQLARHVMTRGRRIVVFDGDVDHAFLRTVLSRAADIEPFLRRARTVKLAALRG